MIYLVIVFLILYSILCFKQSPWAVMLMLALLPSYQIRFDVLGVPMTLLEAMIFIAFAVWLWQDTKFKDFIFGKYKIKNYLENRKKRMPYPFSWEIGALLIISWIAIISAGGNNAALGVWKAYFFEPVLVFILIINVFGMKSGSTASLAVESLKRVEKILWPLMVSALIVSLFAIFQRVSGLFIVEEFWPRVTGVYEYPNALGLFLGPIILIMAGWFLAKISNLKSQISNKLQTPNPKFQVTQILIIGLAIIFSLIAIVLARSEGAAAGVLIAVVLLGGIELILYLEKKLLKVALGIAGLIMAIILVYPVLVLNVFPKYYYPNFDCKILKYTISKLALKDLSGEIRKQQWRETWEMIKKDNIWLLGTGLSNYQAKIKPYHQEGIFFNFSGDPDFRRKIVWWDEKYKAENWQPVEIYMYPHNLVLNFWSELGILGMVLFVWIIGKFLIVGSRIYNANPRTYANIANSNNANRYVVLGLVGAMVVVVVHGIVDVPYFKNDLAILFWMFLAIMGLLDTQANNNIGNSFGKNNGK